jgi:hypothetical protein
MTIRSIRAAGVRYGSSDDGHPKKADTIASKVETETTFSRAMRINTTRDPTSPGHPNRSRRTFSREPESTARPAMRKAATTTRPLTARRQPRGETDRLATANLDEGSLDVRAGTFGRRNLHRKRRRRGANPVGRKKPSTRFNVSIRHRFTQNRRQLFPQDDPARQMHRRRRWG